MEREMQSIYFSLLQQWCDALLAQQVQGLGEAFDGAFLCPACKYEHGRCQDAVYPLLYMAKRTGENKYLNAAKAVFDWQEKNLFCDDGSIYNDPNSAWDCITVFSAISLCEALEKHGSLLDTAAYQRWTSRLTCMASWLYTHLDEFTLANINYCATNSAALALCGKFLHRDDYCKQAQHLAHYALERITPNGLLYGEGKPRDALSARGCRPIDIGYNVEESIPSLVKYAVCENDTQALEKLTDVLGKQLLFMLPDGAWDNSFGTRSNKWTYYGSRTSDGCQAAYALLADRNPLFAEAALRNTLLMQKCSQGGLLHGGPEYPQHGERPCVHHTFTHANALACALDAGIEKFTHRTALPADNAQEPLRYFPEVDTYKIATGDWRATVTGFDFAPESGHASGGTLTFLWHKKTGPLIAGSVVDYKLVEALNQQLSIKKSRHRTLVPRVECIRNKVRYAQCYDTRAVLTASQKEGKVVIQVNASLVNLQQQMCFSPLSVLLRYTFSENGIEIKGKILGDNQTQTVFVLPLIGEKAFLQTENKVKTDSIFFLTGGFGAIEYTITPDTNGEFSLIVRLP